MPTFVVIIIIAMLGGIIYLNREPKGTELSREEFFRKLNDYVEGKLEPVKGCDDSYRVRFKYNNENFIYEEIETASFKDRVVNASLKLETNEKLDLALSERKADKFLKAGDLSQSPKSKRVRMPKGLETFEAHTNDPDFADKLLADSKAAGLFNQYKNMDARGYPFVSLRIVRGVIILDFSASKIIHPNIYELRHEVAAIENISKKLLVLSEKIRHISSQN